MDLCRACSRLCLECAATRVVDGEGGVAGIGDAVTYEHEGQKLNVTVDDVIAVFGIFSFDGKGNVVGLTPKQKGILLTALSAGKGNLSVSDITQPDVVDFVKKCDETIDSQAVVDGVLNLFKGGTFAKFEKKKPEDQNERKIPAEKSRSLDSSPPPIAVKPLPIDKKRKAGDARNQGAAKRKVERNPP
jgi:hypothetical protein